MKAPEIISKIKCWRSKSHFIVMVLGILFFQADDLFGQNEADSANYRNLSFLEAISASHELSYITILGGAGNIEPLMFEAAIVPYYMLRLNQNTRWAMEFSTKIIIRMYNERSLPIRTPSYMPRATLYINVGRLDSRIQKQFFFVSWAHHSNGQSGLFADSITHEINTYDGDFTTNFIEAGPFFSRVPYNKSFVTDYLKLSLTYNYKQSEQIKGLYGIFRINQEMQSIITLPKPLLKAGVKSNTLSGRKHSSLRLTIKNSLILGDMSEAKTNSILNRITTSWILAYRPAMLEDMSFFIQYYYGQDYYNIWFARNLSVFRIGIQADTFQFLNKHK